MASDTFGEPPVTVEGTLKLVTLGATRLLACRLKSGQEPVELLPAGKGLALITYLHCLPNREASRDELIEQFWNNSTPRAAQGALRQLLYRLRGDLGQDPIVSRGHDSAVALALDITSDRDLFLAATQDGRDTDAVDLYTGTFFPGYAAPGAAGFEQWADLERERLKLAFLRSAATAVRQALDRPNNKEAVRLADKARDCCPESQAAWCLLLEALLAGGNRARALLEADHLVTQFAADDETLEPATERLLAKVRQSEAVVPLRSADSPRDPLVTELVGREREFAMLLDAWQRCQHTRAVHVHLTAPAGLGKTRLLHELANRLRPSRAAIALVGAIPGEREVDHAFISDAVEALTLLPGWRAIAPGTLAELSALAPSLSAYRQDRGDSRSSIGSTATLIQAITELVSCVAGEVPLAVLLDDLHWADEQSLQIVNSLLNRLKSERVLIVTTARPIARTLPATSSTQIVELAPLSADAVLGMLSSLGADVGTYEVTALAEMLHRKSNGSPLLVLELLHLAIQQGKLHIDETGWTWTDPAAALRDIGDDDPLRLRIEGLSVRARTLLALLSTAQAPVPLDVLTSVDSDAHQVLLELEKEGLAGRTGHLVHPAHEEVAAAALRSVPDAEGRAAHAVLGEWLFTQLEKDRSAFRRSARHFREAGQPDRVRALFRAQVALARRQGSETSLREFARQALGPNAQPSEHTRLIRSLSWFQRLTYARNARYALLVGALLAGAVAVRPMLTKPPPEPEAVLLVSSGGSSERIRIHGIPISRTRWSGPDTISLREGRVLGRLPLGHRLYNDVVMSPDGRLVFDQIVSDSGEIDLMLLEKGGLRRLTATPGDDITPDWSPDGRLLVFATSRWTPPGDEDSDLAILDPETGSVRQLTGGRHYDVRPQWSPDGVHIGFDRIDAETGVLRPCVVTFDGLTERCAPMSPGDLWYRRGWRTGDQLVLSRNINAASSAITTWFLGADSLSGPVTIPARVEGVGTATALATAAVGPGAWRLIDLERPDGRNLVLPGRESDSRTGWFQPRLQRRYLANVRIEPRQAAAVAGLDHRFHVAGADRDGQSVDVPASALRWSVSDTDIADIDPTTGRLFARGEGTVRIHASAGGWRTDSVDITIVAGSVHEQFTEPWTEPLEDRWAPHGDPLPSIVVGPDGMRGLLNGGDDSFSSGAVSKTPVSAPSFGFETLVSTPIDRPKWQRLVMTLIRDVTLTFSGPSGVSACAYQIPVGEGVQLMGEYNISVGGVPFRLPSTSRMRSGDWYRVRIQTFPDGTCGVAVDGAPIVRHRTQVSPGDMWYLRIDGQTVGTKMLVGPIEAWTGVRTDIDWSTVDMPQPVSRSEEIAVNRGKSPTAAATAPPPR